ncbi:hypothetical protein PIB30_090819 [Stylosanthes scabra]|uniref:Uncharacterized protein n=1 Tax=Stylosanthes scabra TaxID=79078 RepID=A0ABU6RUA9_9FABA|nr:hypothetical protein [Stylosanthes scabra]
MKKKVKIRNQGKESLKEESEEEKGKRRIEFKCNSVEDLIGKLLTFKKEKEQKEAWKARKEQNRATRQKQSYSNHNRGLMPRRHYPHLGVAELASYLSLIQHQMPKHDARRLGVDGSARKLALHQGLNA